MALIEVQKISNGELPRGGKAYFGIFGNEEPENNPIQVFTDFLLTKPLDLSISSLGVDLDRDGMTLVNGQRTSLYIAVDFSFMIRDSKGARFWTSAQQNTVVADEIIIDQIWEVIGVPQGSVNMGPYNGDLIDDDGSIKENIQQLETAVESSSLFQSLDDLRSDTAFAVGTIRSSSEYNTGSGVGSGLYEKVSINPGLNIINPTTTDGNFLKLLFDNSISTYQAGMIAGGPDSAVAFAELDAACVAAAVPMLINNASFAIESAITISADIISEGYYTNEGPTIQVNIPAQGVEVIAVEILGAFRKIDNLTIRGTKAANVTLFRAGTAAAAVTRSDFGEIWILDGVRAGYLYGWENRGSFRVRNCDDALEIEQANAGEYYINSVTCVNHTILKGCIGGKIQLTVQDSGANVINGAVIQGCVGVNLTGIYIEFQGTPNLVSALKTTDLAGAFNDNLDFSSGSAFLNITTVGPAFDMDFIRGMNWGLDTRRIGLGSESKGISWGDNVSDINITTFGMLSDNGYYSAQNNAMSQKENYTDDPILVSHTAQFNNILLTNTTISKDSVNYLTGRSSIRVDLLAVAGNVASFQCRSNTFNALAGKTVTLGVMLFVPDLPQYADRSVRPAVGIFDGVTGPVLSSNNVDAGAWNLLFVNDFVFDAAATRLDIRIFPASISGGFVGDEFVLVDSMYVIESTGNITKAIAGEYKQFADSNQVLNGRFIGKGTPSANADVNFEVGDQFLYDPVVTAAFERQICTTAGTGGTAVFTDIIPT